MYNLIIDNRQNMDRSRHSICLRLWYKETNVLLRSTVSPSVEFSFLKTEVDLIFSFVVLLSREFRLTIYELIVTGIYLCSPSWHNVSNKT